MPIVTLRRSRAGNGRIESLIRVAGLHQNLGTYFEQGKANSYFDLPLGCMTTAKAAARRSVGKPT